MKQFGTPDTEAFMVAQHNFMLSLVGYSLIGYLLQLKDRHNGNVLVDAEGHCIRCFIIYLVIHIDFGFILHNSPGSVGFEMAPFKLPQEYLDILGGMNSEKFSEFKKLMFIGFLGLRKNADEIITLVELMQKGLYKELI